MPLSSKILRGLKVKGHTIYSPPPPEKNFPNRSAGSGLQQQSSVNPREKIKQEENILEKFQQEGEKLRRQLLEQASEEARLLKEQAWEEAFAKGRKEGDLEAKKLVEEAQAILEQARKERQETLAGAEPEIIKIAVSIAEKLLDYKIETDEGCILSLMARALNTIPAGENVLLKLNPRDEEICRKKFNALRELLQQDIVIELQGDQEIPPGSCKVESEEVEVELLVHKELEILGNKLLEMAIASGRRRLLEKEEEKGGQENSNT